MYYSIVVEGPDGSGKSRLVTSLEEKYKVKARHSKGPCKANESFEEKVRITKDDFILDRWAPISEQIYGQILRGKTAEPIDALMWYIHQYNPHIIYCRPPMSSLIHNLGVLDNPHKTYKSKTHCSEVRRNYDLIVEAYDRLMRLLIKSGILVTVYDYTGEKLL